MKQKKINILKSGFFLTLFCIPSICWILLEVLLKNTPNDDGSLTTWPELLQETFIVIAFWFIVSFVIALIVSEVKKNQSKTKIIKEIKHTQKSEEKGVLKPQTILKAEKAKKDSKCLYTCESIVDGYEYKKMAKYFPKRVYWVFVIRGLISNLIVSSIIAITSKNLVSTLAFFTICQIFLMVLYKVRLEYYSEKEFNRIKKQSIADTNFETEFYGDHLIRKGESVTFTIKYSEISRCVENDTNFYLECADKNMIIILQKNRCDLELINFIRSKFKNPENNIVDTSSYKKIKSLKNTKLISTLMIILFIATICSLWGALWSLSLIDEINPQHGFNFTKNAWIFWCWLPLPIVSIILGFIFESKGFKCTKNIVAGFIIGFLLLVYGSFGLIPSFSKDYSKINDYKEYIDASIPNNGELEIQNWKTYFDDDKTEYVIINAYYDKEDVSNLLSSIQNSNNWVLSTKMKSELKILLPTQFRAQKDVYYSIYNKTTNEYNTIPSESGKYEMYAMYYDKSLKQLSIHRYKYSYNK